MDWLWIQSKKDAVQIFNKLLRREIGTNPAAMRFPTVCVTRLQMFCGAYVDRLRILALGIGVSFWREREIYIYILRESESARAREREREIRQVL